MTEPSNPLADVEAEHGFVFGGPVEPGTGRHTATVSCTAPTCSRRGQHIAVHDDTVQPLHCGDCFAVLHCDHTATEVDTFRTGTIGQPMDNRRTTCTTCQIVLEHVKTPGQPVNLATLPAALLDAPLA